MKVVVQRVSSASVKIDQKIYNEIDKGYLLLVGFTHNDNIEDINYVVSKIVNLRIFNDENDKMNKSILDINGRILSISQFTLYGSTKKGNRPSFVDSMKYDDAAKLYEVFNDKLNEHVKTYSGVFGADMKVNLVNDGPVTIIIDSNDR